MANITTSTFTSDIQKDGRHQVHELHTDLIGKLHELFYLAEAADDLNANLALHATNLGLALADAEIDSNIAAAEALGSQATPTFHYSTPAQNAAAVRVAYKTMTQLQAIMVGDYLNTLSAATLESIFGITAGQEATLKTMLQNAATQATAIRAAAGQ